MPDDILKRVPPQNLDAEQSVLGAVLLDNRALDDVMATLRAEHFYRETHREIYRAMLSLSATARPIDAITLSEVLRTQGMLEAIGGPGYLAELAAAVPSAAMIVHYASIVRDKFILREIASTATRIASEAFDNPQNVGEFADGVARDIARVVDPSIQSHTVEAPELSRNALRAVEDAAERREMVTGLATGLLDLDRVTAGLQNSELIVIAARPGMGKTALAVNIAGNVAMRGRRSVLFCSLEMSAQQLGLRLLCSEARVNLSEVRAGMIAAASYPALAAAGAGIADSPLFVDDSSYLSPLAIKAIARRIARRVPLPLGLIVIDYIQLMKPPRGYDSREREVAEVSRDLKALAKEFDIPVIALAQLNRQLEGRDGHRPRLSDLRESGAIEQDADVVIFIHNENYYKKRDDQDPAAPCKLIVAKQRNGPIADVNVTWSAPFTRFDNYAAPQGEEHFG